MVRSDMVAIRILVATVAVWLSHVQCSKESSDVYTNQFHVVLQHPGGLQVAKRVEHETGFTLLRPHLYSKREYVFTHRDLPHASNDGFSPKHKKMLNDHPEVYQVRQMPGYRRTKRGFRSAQSAKYNKKGIPLPQTSERQQQQSKENQRQKSILPTDPLFKKEWYILNNGQADGVKNLDLNAVSAWQEGITGKGITTAIMDDGVDYMHPDLRDHFNAEASYDFSSNDPYPYPRYTDDWFNSHGTRCAGEIAAARDNGICGVGVAYGGKVAGIRMLDQPYMTDLIEAAAMSHKRDDVDIYSASWGPTDDGKTVDGPRNETMRALVDGVNKGRHGKGNIYVWASGDGGPNDDCNCDGYAASMWTVSINSATNDGEIASYDESCSSTLASTFSNGKAWYSQDAGVGTIDLYGNCTLHHSGTSAAAPEAAGVFALALEANPLLTWRDLQHLTVLTSKRNHLHDRLNRHNWTINGAGLEFNHLFGYGVLDAGDIVKLAKKWQSVPTRYHCIAGEIKKPMHFNVSRGLVLEINTDACFGKAKSQVNYLEHVQAFVTVKGSRRGDVTMFLTSPMNTTSMILSRRPKDDDKKRGFTKWPFMTTHTWGENPRGKWRLTVVFDTHDPYSSGLLSEWVLVLHGVQEKPYDKLPDSLDKLIPKLAVVKRQHNRPSFSKQ